jgi:GNAT superfamily N-acetyltransferase
MGGSLNMRSQLVDTTKPEVQAAISWLHAQCFPSDDSLDSSTGYWWLVRDGVVPIAFAVLREVDSWENTGYMARCGVLEGYRGNGLQRRLLQVRERKARNLGMERVITTTYNNPRSANNLIKRHFLTYLPTTKWGAPDTIYWVKNLEIPE